MARFMVKKCPKCDKTTTYINIFDMAFKIEQTKVRENGFIECVYHWGEKVLIDFNTEKKRPQVEPPKKRTNTNGHTFYDTGTGKFINTKEIDKIAKENGYVYLSDREIEQETKKNKEYIEQRNKTQFRNGLQQTLREAGF